MDIPILLTTYDRHQYLERSLASLAKTNFPENCKLFIYDDASKHESVIPTIKKFKKSVPIKVHLAIRQQNLGVTVNTLLGMKAIFDKYPYLIRINDDCIYNPNWILKLLETKNYVEALYDVGMITCFHTEVSKESRMEYNHEVIKTLENGIRMKSSAGGLGAVIYKEVLLKMTTYNSWDCRYVDACKEMNKRIFATDKSYIQHIGKFGVHSSTNYEYDKALDFVGENK